MSGKLRSLSPFGRVKNVRLQRKHLGLVFGGFLLLPFILFALAPSLFATHDPLKSSLAELYLPPGPEHWFGTDELGRDIFSRVVYGARVSLVSASATILFASFIGVPLGMVAGYMGGWVDRLVMIGIDMVLSFPSLVLALAVGAALGPSLPSAVLAISVVWWPVYARLVRGITMQLKEMEYIEASVGMGATSFHILRRHILPNALSSIIVRVSLDLGFAVLLLASLSFVGLGAAAPSPEWGAMVAWGRLYFLTEWWIGGFPALAITFVVIGITLAGDALNDILNPN